MNDSFTKGHGALGALSEDERLIHLQVCKVVDGFTKPGLAESCDDFL